jgi:hypothetical protein
LINWNLNRKGSMNIYQIKRETQETAPFFFSRENMKFFNQTLRDFRVKRQRDGRTRISAPIRQYSKGRGSRYFHYDYTGDVFAYTVRFYNPETKELDMQ